MISGIKSSLRMLQIKSWGDFEEGIIDRTTLDKLDTAVYWLTNIAKSLKHLLTSNLRMVSYKKPLLISKVLYVYYR